MNNVIISQQSKRSNEDWGKWSAYRKLLTECPRPSKQDMNSIGKIMNKKLKNIKKPTIAILGATPEYRDLCTAYAFQYDAQILCIELVEDMYRAMSDLTKVKNLKEKVVFSNWLDIKLKNNSVDIVVGDLTEGNISLDLKDKYLDEINRILKDGGVYVTRHTIFLDSKEVKPLMNLSQIRKLLNSYIQSILEGEITVYQAGNFLGARLIWDSYYKNNERKNILSVYKNEIKSLKEDLKKNPLAKEIFEIFDKAWGPMKNKYWEYSNMETTIKHFKSKFKSIKLHYSHDYPVSHLTPICEMIKKEHSKTFGPQEK